MSAKRKMKKFTGESRSYSIDWTNRLSNANDGIADTIANSVWTVDVGIIKVADTISGSVSIIQVSGGTALATYKLENTITLSTSGYILIDYLIVYISPEPVS